MEAPKLLEYYTEEDYYARPDDVRTELIDGVFYDMAAPTQIHQELVGAIYRKIADFIDSNKGKCKVIPSPFDVKLEENKDNIVQPDISIICDSKKLDGKRCNGAPDWVIEIVSSGNPAHDYVKKLNLYQKAGVREYWIINPDNDTVLTYLFDATNRIETYTFNDIIPSGIFDKLKIDLPGIMERIRPSDT